MSLPGHGRREGGIEGEKEGEEGREGEKRERRGGGAIYYKEQCIEGRKEGRKESYVWLLLLKIVYT